MPALRPLTSARAKCWIIHLDVFVWMGGPLETEPSCAAAGAHVTALALACTEPALLGQCGSGGASTRCAYGTMEALRTAWAALLQTAARHGGRDAVRLQLERLGGTLQPTVVEYALEVLAGAGEGQPKGGAAGAAAEQGFELQPVLRLLTVMPSLLGTFLAEVAAASGRMGDQVSGSAHAMRLLCEVLSVQELRASLLDLRLEVSRTVGALVTHAEGAGEVTAAGRAAADASHRLEGLRKTLFGIDV